MWLFGATQTWSWHEIQWFGNAKTIRSKIISVQLNAAALSEGCFKLVLREWRRLMGSPEQTWEGWGGRGSRQKASDGNKVESEQEWQQARIFVELKKLVCWSNIRRLWVQAYSKGADSRTLYVESEQDWEEQASGVESQRIEELDLLETHSGAEGESLSSCRQDARAAQKGPSRWKTRAGGTEQETQWQLCEAVLKHLFAGRNNSKCLKNIKSYVNRVVENVRNWDLPATRLSCCSCWWRFVQKILKDTA